MCAVHILDPIDIKKRFFLLFSENSSQIVPCCHVSLIETTVKSLAIC